MKSKFAAAFLFTTATFCGPCFASPVYDLRLYNVDDVLSAYIINANYSNQLILQELFLGDTGYVNISSYIAPGANDIFLQLYNGPQGWTYGYDFTINGTTFDSGACGTINIFGCNNNEYVSGYVWSQDILFNAVGTNTAIPEPASGSLLIGGLLDMLVLAGAGLATRKRLPA